MDLIYSKARSVRICIPDSLPETSAKYSQLFRYLDGQKDNTAIDKSDLYNTLRHLFSLRYFSRVWVIQEVALARLAYLLVNDQVLRLTASVLRRMSRLCRLGSFHMPGFLAWSPDRFTEAGIITCLRASTYGDATDPRDRIFAVLSLVEAQERSLIPIDYSMSLEVVSSNAMAAIIATQQNLEILSYMNDYDTPHSLATRTIERYLDWTGTGENQRRHSLRFFEIPRFEGESNGPWRATTDFNMASFSGYEEAVEQANDSCFIRRPRANDINPRLRFRVRAHHLDTVDGTCPRTKGATGFRRGENWLNRVSEKIPEFSRRLGFWSDERQRPFWLGQTTGESSVIQDPLDTTNHSLQSRIWTWRYKAMDAFTALRRAVSDGTLFSTQFSVGMTDWVPQMGDEIFAIDGATMPFILRATGPRQYQIVGPCFLWAALNQDYWSVRKEEMANEWGLHGPAREQTEMIEIC